MYDDNAGSSGASPPLDHSPRPSGSDGFYAGLSPDSRAARFHGATPTIPDATARFFCGPDHQHREGIVAESFDPSGDR